MSRVTHQRATSGKEHGRVVNRGVNDQRARRCFRFYELGETKSFRVEHLILNRSESDPGNKTRQKIMQDAKNGSPAKPNGNALANNNNDSDDGLQADERDIQTDLKREQAAKEKRDVVLDEAAHILADEISLIRTDTKLAARVLPRGVIMPTEVD